nr:MAG TPA: hypothetical protein [Caudoviricetes sp.]
MATYNWYDDDEEKKKKEDELNSSIQSVQDGWNSANKGWQPAQNDAAGTGRSLGIFAGDAGQQGQDGNYLMSDEKAQVDENKRRQDEAEAAARAQAAAAAAAAAQAQAAAAAQAQAAQSQQSRGQSFDEAEAAAAAQVAAVKHAKAQYTPPKQEEGLWGLIKSFAAGMQQGIGNVADTVIQGGHVLNYLKDRAIGVDEDTAAKNLWQSGEKMRKVVHSMKDVNGHDIVGTQDADAAAGRVAAGQGNVRDIISLGSKGIQTGLDATMFVNPGKNLVGAGANIAKDASYLSKLKPVAIQSAKEAGFYGGLMGTSSAGRVYGDTGDVNLALQAGANDAVFGGVSQFGMNMGAHGMSQAARFGREKISGLKERLNPTETPTIHVEETPSVNLKEEPKGSVFDESLRENADPNLSSEKNPNRTPEVNEQVPNNSTNVNLQEQAPNVLTSNKIDQSIPTEVQNTPLDRTNAEVQPAVDQTAMAKKDLAMAENPVPVKKAPIKKKDLPQISEEERLALLNDFRNRREDILPGRSSSVDTKLPTYADIKNFKEFNNHPVSQATEATINAKLKQAEKLVPVKKAPKKRIEENSLPDGMGADGVPGEAVSASQPLTMKELAKRMVSGSSKPTDFKNELARSVGLAKDGELPVTELLAEAKVKQSIKDRYAEKYAQLEALTERQNEIQREHRKLVAKDQLTEPVETTKEWSRLERQRASLAQELNNMNRFIDSRNSLGNKIAYGVENVVSAKNANQLVSAPGVERNLFQDTLGTVESFIKNPVRSIQALPNGGNPFKSAAKSAMDNWKIKPLGVTDAYRWLIGNTLETTMAPVSGVAGVRKAPIREAVAEAGLRMAGKNPTRQEIINFSHMLDPDSEALINVLSGVHNHMTNRRQANRAIKAWVELVQTGSDAARNRLHKEAERQHTLTQKLMKSFESDGTPSQRVAASLTEAALPYARVATNAAINAAYRLVPSKSIIDEVLASTRSNPRNFMAAVTNTAFNYGLVDIVAGMIANNVLVYSNGDGGTKKPRGLSIHVGGDNYIPIRATNVETEIAGAYTAVKIAQGKMNLNDAATVLSDSLPYMSSVDNIAGAANSFMQGDNREGDNLYQAKNFAVSNIKSLVPGSNNGIQPWLAGKKGLLEFNILKGDSLNAKSTYDKDFGKWVTNSVRAAYDPWFRETLPDSRDAAGRVRTVDNQGIVIHKQINDKATAEFDPAIQNLFEYGKQNGLGKNVREMFDSYNSGKNNNFRSIHNAVTFLDTENGKPDNAKKLEKNSKLADLSRQIRDGYFGDSGGELLTLDGKELKSDVSIPNASGNKNTQLPISMQSIKNAIAQTDLPSDQRNALYEISNQKTNLYNSLKNKQISYDEYNTAKTALKMQENDILAGSAGYQKLNSLMNKLNENGFFDEGGLGSTKSGQTYLWNALNSLLGDKGTTPAAEYKKDEKYTPWGGGYRRGFYGFGGGGRRGSGFGASDKTGNRGDAGLQWGAVKGRSMENVGMGKYTPVSIKTTVNGRIKRNKTQNYDGRSI